MSHLLHSFPSAFRPRTGRPARRLWAAVLVAVLSMMSVAFVLPTGSAHAATVGGFEIDGNTANDPNVVGGDWGNNTAACVYDGLNDSNGGIKGAESDNPMDWAAGDPESGKTDLVHSAVVSAEVDGERWAYVGLQRGEANTGTTTYSVEFNQQANKLSSPKSGTAIPVPNRLDGDIKIDFQQTGNGDIVVTGFYRWEGGAWVSQDIPENAIVGASNVDAIGAVTFCGTSSPVRTFMELAINLTAFGLGDQGCEGPGFNTVNIRSWASNSENSQLSDTTSSSVDIPRNCATATIVKKNAAGEVITAGSGVLTFTISPDPATGVASSSVTIVDNSSADLDTRAGYVSFETEIFSTYTVTETVPPPGYFLPWPADQRSQTVTLATDDEKELTFVDPTGTLSWTKVDAATGEKLCGASFTVQVTTNGAGSKVKVQDNGPYDLDKDCGEFQVTGLMPGLWVLTEVVAPPGYALPTGALWSQQVGPGDSPVWIVEGAIDNTKVRAVWTKVDEYDHEMLLGGSEWKLVGPNEEVIDVTDCIAASAAECTGADKDPAAGKFAVEGLVPGFWSLHETKAPVGYAIVAEPVTIEVTSGAAEFNFGAIENRQNGQIAWNKYDDQGMPLAGAVFRVCEFSDVEPTCWIVEDNTGQVDYVGDDADPRPGRFLVHGLPFGNYTVVEIEAPEGYLLDEGVMFVPVGPSVEPLMVGDFINAKKVYGLTLSKAAYEGENLTDGTVGFGDTVTYQLTLGVTGNAPSTNVTVTDTLPTGVTYVSGSAHCLSEAPSSCDAVYDAATHTLTWSFPELDNGLTLVLAFDVTVDAAPHVEPGTTYTWTGDNVGAAMSDQTPKVPSNIVTIKASKTVLPETGGNSLPLVLGGILAILAGGALVMASRRRENTGR